MEYSLKIPTKPSQQGDRAAGRTAAATTTASASTPVATTGRKNKSKDSGDTAHTVTTPRANATAAATGGGTSHPNHSKPAWGAHKDAAASAQLTAAERLQLASSAKKSLRSVNRERKVVDDEAAVAAASSALLDSIVPPQLVQSAATYVFAGSPRVFSFHARHVTSFRHPFMSMLCTEAAVADDGDAGGDNNNNNNNGGTIGSSNMGSMANNAGGKSQQQQQQRPPTTTAAHRGGASMTSAAHVGAVEHALKSRRRTWQSLSEYVTTRLSDTNTGFPIEIERWRQASYMFDSVLLEEDLVRRRREILESVLVVRALEACWTSWGGTTTSGIDFDTYRAQHLRVYQHILNIDVSRSSEHSFATFLEACIAKDFAVDKEIANYRSGAAVRGRSPVAGASGGGDEAGGRASGGGDRNSPLPAANNSGGGGGSPLQRRGSMVGSESNVLGSTAGRTNSFRGGRRLGRAGSVVTASDTTGAEALFEVPFRKFCVSMLELADNWIRLRVGEVAALVFAKFLTKVAWAPPSSMPSARAPVTSTIPPSLSYAAHEQHPPQHHQQPIHISLKPNDDDFPIEAHQQPSSRLGTPGAGSRADAAAVSRSSTAANNNNNGDVVDTGANDIGNSNHPASGAAPRQAVDSCDEWEKICASLRRRACTHRGPPLVRLVPPQCPGVPPTYVAMASPDTALDASTSLKKK